MLLIHIYAGVTLGFDLTHGIYEMECVVSTTLMCLQIHVVHHHSDAFLPLFLYDIQSCAELLLT